MERSANGQADNTRKRGADGNASGGRGYRKDLPQDAKWERARALALACRFCGLPHVRALVENGASIGRNLCYLLFALLDINRAARMFVEDRMYKNKYLFAETLDITDKNGAPKTLKLLPTEKRAEIVRYLCENSKRVRFDRSKLLLYSILSNDKKLTAALKEMGVSFSQKHISALTENRRKDGWNEYYVIEFWYDDDEYFDILQGIVKEIGERKLLFDDHILGYDRYTKNRWYYSDPEKFGFILEHFDQKKMYKITVMKCAILEDSVACLEICTKHGWLTKLSDRDELIKFASEQNKTECLAFLLDYKNRNLDLEAEREKAERIARRKLNAAPDSVTALRELFRWKKQEDSTLVITGYKGTKPVIYVPARIGRSAVTAIDVLAFSMDATHNIPKAIKDPRFKMTEIVLPDSIRSIGAAAFRRCIKLEKINIPDNVTFIGNNAFSSCHKLTDIVIPGSVKELGNDVFFRCKALRTVTLLEGVKKIGDSAFGSCDVLTKVIIPASVTTIGKNIFYECPNVTAVVEPNSCAEEYCKQNNIPFRHGTADDLKSQSHSKTNTLQTSR